MKRSPLWFRSASWDSEWGFGLGLAALEFLEGGRLPGVEPGKRESAAEPIDADTHAAIRPGRQGAATRRWLSRRKRSIQSWTGRRPECGNAKGRTRRRLDPEKQRAAQCGDWTQKSKGPHKAAAGPRKAKGRTRRPFQQHTAIAVISALARLEARVALADHENLAAAAHDFAVAVALLRGLQRIQHFHGIAPRNSLHKDARG